MRAIAEILVLITVYIVAIVFLVKLMWDHKKEEKETKKKSK